jgi:hypothetical protein
LLRYQQRCLQLWPEVLHDIDEAILRDQREYLLRQHFLQLKPNLLHEQMLRPRPEVLQRKLRRFEKLG